MYIHHCDFLISRQQRFPCIHFIDNADGEKYVIESQTRAVRRKTDVALRQYISLLRFVTEVAGGLASFLHTRNRQFLAPFHPEFPPVPRPPSFSAEVRAPHPFFLYSLFTSFAHIIPSFFTPLCESSRVSFATFPSRLIVFILLHLPSSYSICLFYHHAYLCSLYHVIIFALLLPCPSSHPHLFLLSLPLSLVCSNSLR